MTKILMVALLLLGVVRGAYAATIPSSISRAPLVRGNVSDRLSIGVDYDQIQRDIAFKAGGMVALLEADSVSGYVGYDALRWLTAFMTMGGTSLRGDQWISADYALRASIGLNAYVWEADVLSPSFAAGRVSIKGTMEVLRHATDTNAGSSDWLEFFAALPLGYEFFDRYPAGKSGFVTSLALHVGPAISLLDGDLAVAPGSKQGFKQHQAFGVVAGMDVFFAPTVSLGVKALVFDQASAGASLRFHF